MSEKKTDKQREESGKETGAGSAPGQVQSRIRGQGGVAGDQPQAIFSKAGAAWLDYDQYEVNQPESLSKQSGEERESGSDEEE